MRATLRPAPLLAIALLACGGRGGGASPAGGSIAAPPDEECRAGDVAACLADARSACGGEGAAHRLRYGGLPPLAVGPAGLVAVEHLGGLWISTDATRWLACHEECPAGGGGRICFPLVTPLRVSWSSVTGCQERSEPAPPWRDMPSEVTVLTCPDGESRLRRVPELDPVRRDLVRAGVIEEGDVLARLDGLVVEMGAGDAVSSALEELAPADCSVFDLPDGYRVVSGPEAFSALERGAAAERAERLAAEVEKVRARVAVEAVRAAKAALLPALRAEYGERCRAEGHDPADDAQMEACAARIPETEAPFRAAVARETRRLLAAHRAELDALTRDLLIAPLCRENSAAP